MSMLALAATLEHEYEFAFVDGNCDLDPVQSIRSHVHAGANVLATTVMPGPQLMRAVPHTRTLKDEFPDLITVWGGYFPTQHSETCLKEGYVDYVVRGHGEIVFKSLLGTLERGGDMTRVVGLSYRADQDRIVENKPAPIPHPEKMPAWPYDRIEMREYVRTTFMGSRTLPHHSSYGCPFLCDFCGVVNMVNGRWLAQSAKRVAETAELYVRNWGVDAIEFYDSNFFTQEARVAEIAERIMPLHLGWWGEGRIDTMLKFSPRTWALMRDSGLKMVFMGAETGSEDTLRQMNKGGTLTPAMTLEMAARTKEYGIIPEFSFVLGNPPDAEKDISDSIEFVRRVKRVNPASEIILYTYTPVPLNGGLYDQAVSSGFRFPETLDEWVTDQWLNFAQRHSDDLPWLESRLIRRVRNFERVLNAYYPTSTDSRLKGAWRKALRSVGAWRYNAGIYEFPLELKVMQKLMHYQRPETSGF